MSNKRVMYDHTYISKSIEDSRDADFMASNLYFTAAIRDKSSGDVIRVPYSSLTQKYSDILSQYVRIVGYTESGKPKYKKYDFPEFMKYTREIKYTKDGKELPQEEIDESKNKLKSRINRDLSCPMNWLEDWINKIQNASTAETIPTEHFFVKMDGYANNRQMTKIRQIVEEYDSYIKAIQSNSSLDDEMSTELIIDRSKFVLDELSKIKVGNIVTINRLIETSLGIEPKDNGSIFYNKSQKYTRKMLNCLYKMNKDKFLLNFN